MAFIMQQAIQLRVTVLVNFLAPKFNSLEMLIFYDSLASPYRNRKALAHEWLPLNEI
jgi:hypothetical protein